MSKSADRSEDRRQPIQGTRRVLPAAHIFGLWAFAVAQPIFDLIGKEPDFLVAHRLSGVPLLALALGLSLAMPALLAAPLAHPATTNGRIGRWYLNGLRALLAAAFLLQLLDLELLANAPAAPVAALALAGGVGLVLVLHRWHGFAQLVGITAAAALIAPTLFLVRPGVRTLLPGDLPGEDFRPPPEIAQAAAFASDLPIVLVVFDELPASSLQRQDGSIDPHRFPAFAELAIGSDWYRRAVTVGLQTSKAIPALLTGRQPRPGGTAHYRDHSNNLFTWLAVAGRYRIVAQETLSLLCPPAICAEETRPGAPTRLAAVIDDLGVVYAHLLLPTAFTDSLPDIRNTWTDFRDASRSPQEREGDRPGRGGALNQDVPRLVADFLDRMRPVEDSAPGFYYLHLNIPHRPWKYLPSGREYRPVGARALPHGFDGRRLPEDEWLTVHGLQRHLLQVGYADRVLGQLMDRLRSLGMYDQALIIVTADHGHSFRPGVPRRLPTETNLEDVLEVPLFVKRPGQARGSIFEHAVRTIDIVPTIAAAAGAEPPWTVDGLELSDDSARNLTTCCFDEGEAVQSFRTDPARRQQTLDRLHGLFGTETHPFEGVFAAGPRRDLIGRPVTDFTKARRDISSGKAPRAILAGAHAYGDVRPETGFVPSLVSGRIEPGVARSTELADAVDGIVRSTTETFVDGDDVSRFSALVDERWLSAGRRHLDVYAIEEGDPAADQLAVLRPLRDDQPPARLVPGQGGVRGVQLPGGEVLQNVGWLYEHELELVAGGFRGRFIQEPEAEPVLVDEFFVFEGEHLLYRGMDDRFFRRADDRPDGRLEISFRISVPSATASGGSRLRLLARRGGHVQDLSVAPEPAVYELSRNAEGRVDALLRWPAGGVDYEPERIDVTPSAMAGFLEASLPESLGLQGWAADLADPGGNREVVAFLGDRPLWIGRTGVERPDVASRHGDRHRWSGFVLAHPPLDALRDSIEREGVVAYAISRRRAATRLRFAYRPLQRGPRRTEILPASDGRRLTVVSPGNGFDGAIDLVRKRADRTVIEGWAADLERGERPRQIVIYRDGEFLASLGANRERPDVATHHGDDRLLRTGFRATVPGAPDPTEFTERHRVFAIMLRGAALQLRIGALSPPDH